MAHIGTHRSGFRHFILARTLTLRLTTCFFFFCPQDLSSSYQVGSSRGERRRFKVPISNHLHAAQEDNPFIFLAPLAAWAIISSVPWLQLVGTMSFVRSWGIPTQGGVFPPRKNHLNCWLARGFERSGLSKVLTSCDGGGLKCRGLTSLRCPNTI